jgi:hypothetical protein
VDIVWTLLGVALIADAGRFNFDPALAKETEEGRPHSLRVRAGILGMAIDDFAETLRVRLRMPVEGTDETLRHYRSEHGPVST